MASTRPSAIWTFAISRYQSQNSSQVKLYSASQARENWNASKLASTVDTSASSSSRIQRSAAVSSERAGSGRATVAPLASANRVAFHSFVVKLREPAAHSSATAMSEPGFVPRSSVNRVASAP